MLRFVFVSLALTVNFMSGDVVMAQSAKDIGTRNKAVVTESFEAWRTGKGSPFDLLKEDATWTILGRSVKAKTYSTKEAFMSEVIRPFNARMRGGLTPSIRHIYADGNTVIVFFDASGTARDGRPYENTYAWFLDMQDGKVTRAFAFFDSIEFDDYWRRIAP
jgi:ketosteroid isomerase-like protein